MIKKGVLLLFAFSFLLFSLQGAKKKLHIVYLNVGQGDSSLITTPSGKRILIDGGEVDKWDKVLKPYFKSHNITKIDYVIVSHPHSDHLGGILGVVKNMEVGYVYEDAPAKSLLYKTFRKVLEEKGIPHSNLWRGNKLDFGDGLKAVVLHPPKGGFITNHTDSAASDSPQGEDPNLNNQSIVMIFTYGKKKFFYSGDMEHQVDEDMIAHKLNLKANVYKVAHHGSRTSSTVPLLKKMKPELCVISCGKNNKFGHPHKETLDKFKYLKLKYFRTDIDGQIDIWCDGEKLITACKSEPIKFVEKPRIVFNEAGYITFAFKTSKDANVKVKTGYTKDRLSTTLLAPYGKKEFYLTIKKAVGKRVYYQIEASYINDDSQVVIHKGYVTTKSGNLTSDLKINDITVYPPDTYIFQPVNFQISYLVKKEGNYIFRIYADGLMEKHKVIEKNLSLKAGEGEITLGGWKPQEKRPMNVYLVILKNRKRVLIKEVKLKVKEKIVLISGEKRNKFTLKDEMEPMYVYMANKGGYRCEIVKSKITKTLLKKVSILLITDPNGKYQSSERRAIVDFVKKGGALILASEADYYNAGNTQALNEILADLGAKIRFNDDEVLDSVKNAGIPFVPLVDYFPTKYIYPAVKQIVMRSTTSLITADGKKLSGGNDIEIFAAAKGSAYNIDADGENDAVFYMTGETIPVVAGEKIGEGKIAIYGSSAVFTNKVYNGSDKQQTPLFNLSVWDWLTGSTSKLDATHRETEEIAKNYSNLTSKNIAESMAERELYTHIRYTKALKNRLFSAAQAGNFGEIDSFLKEISQYSTSEKKAFYPLLLSLRSRLMALKFMGREDEGEIISVIEKINSNLK